MILAVLAIAFLAWLTIDWPASRTARMLAGYAIRKAAGACRLLFQNNGSWHGND